MPRPAIWTAISATLAAEIAQGHYRPGDRLPAEAALAVRFGVNRHTVRRALAALAEAGTIHARRGAGVFVATRPNDYPIGRRVRFHRNILDTGRTPSRRFSRLETRRADAGEAAALGLSADAEVHVVEGISLADGEVLAVFRSVFPAARLPGFLERLRENGSVTASLAALGVSDYTRAETRLTAKVARGPLALRLRLSEGAPVLRSISLNVDPDGRPVEFGTTWFAGDRVTLTVRPD